MAEVDFSVEQICGEFGLTDVPLDYSGEAGAATTTSLKMFQETYKFSLIKSATSLPYILREDGRKLETLHATERLQFCETTDSRRVGKVDGVKGEVKKEQVKQEVKQKQIVDSEEKAKQEPKAKQEQRMKQDKKGEKRKVGDTTTPESGYGTGNSSRMSEFEDDEKLEESDELSDQTPFKRRKSNKSAETLPRRSESDITFVKATKNKDSVKKKLRLNLPPPACKSENKVVTIPRTRLLLFPNVDTGFLKKYPPIKSKKDRQAYKEEFEKTYSVYLEMEKKMLDNFEEWKRLHALLALPPSPLRNPETIQKKLDQNVLASKKHKDVPKFEYFYEKLRHLKRVCAEWDVKQHQL